MGNERSQGMGVREFSPSPEPHVDISDLRPLETATSGGNTDPWVIYEDHDLLSALPPPRRALFLDRDGTLIYHVPTEATAYDGPLCPAEVYAVEQAAETVSRLVAQGFLPVIVSNQPGIAKGTCSPELSMEITRTLLRILAQRGCRIGSVIYCPHSPKGRTLGLGRECGCRKPATGMLNLARDRYDLLAEQSVMIGDRPSDALAAQSWGCRFYRAEGSDYWEALGQWPLLPALPWHRIQQVLLGSSWRQHPR